MDFSLTDAQKARRAETLAFARARLGRDLVSRDRAGPKDETWREDWEAIAAHGILAALAPEAYGGDGLDCLTAVLMLEALGEGCPDNGLTLAVNGQIWAVMEPILAFGTDAQKRRYLPGLARGALLGAHGMTEARTGSDAFAAQTTAHKRDGGYLLNGEKIYVGLAPVCDVAVVFATTEPAAGRWGLSAFLVEKGDAGFVRGPREEKMGLRTAPFGALALKDCWIPEDRLLGDEGAGSAIFNHSMDYERSFIFASHVGSMARQLADCAAFAAERRVFGQAIEGFQSVSNRLADMRVRLETCRLLLYKTAWLKTQGRACALEAAMAKLHISEAFVASSLDAIRIHGGRGYMTEDGIERDLRDAVGGVIYSGTSDIQRQIIAQMLRSEEQGG